MVLLAAFLGWMFDGVEMGIFPLVARPALQQMQAHLGAVTDTFIGRWMGIITALFLLGAAFGGVLFGWLGDRVGRLRALTYSILTYSIFTGLAYFARVPWHLGALRFIAALGMGGEWSLGVALVMEVWPEKHRPWLAGVIGAACNLGIALIAFLGMFFSVTQQSWRWVVLVGALPAALTFLLRLFVPESERWKQATLNAPVKPFTEIIKHKLVGKMMLATVLSSVVLIGTWGTVQWLPLWADQLTGGLLPKAKAYTQALTGIGSVVGCLLAVWMGEKTNRRFAYFLICIGSLFSCMVLFRTVAVYGNAFLILTFVVGTTTGAFFGWLPLYLPELFPTRVRATGQGFAYNAARVFAAIGALQMGALMKQFDGNYARGGALITLIYLFGAVFIWFCPETKGEPLPE